MSDPTDLQQRFEAQKAAFARDLAAHGGPPLAVRKSRLRLLRRLVAENQDWLCERLAEDFGHRSHDETRLAEILPTLLGIDHVLRRLHRWMRPSKRRTPWLLQPIRAEVRYQPKGVVGIIVPWNYPLSLAAGPLLDALAAGNRVMIKMPEALPGFSAGLAQLIERYFEPDVVTVVEGDVAVAQAFSALPFDHLLFTGSTTVGRQVMAAAAKNLTPVSLELGGKSPAFVAASANLRLAARRIAFAKGLNAGQTCVAPDYVLVPEHRCGAFIEHFVAAVREFWPEYQTNEDYTAVINRHHNERLCALLEAAEAGGAKLHGIDHLPKDWLQDRRLPVVALTDVPADSALLEEEIFGPWLPIVTYRQEAEGIAFMRDRPLPLALYYFGTDRKSREDVICAMPSGGVTVNNALLHSAHPQLPFGGIGPSGMGAYHGIEGFRTFSHARSVIYSGRMSSLNWLYPPYGRQVHQWVRRWLLR
ncbi:MAG: coniferyl aldehyde dehydrogenase [Natronospirillum sp.]|uniref:coniferyl aldehyde dehydrogenase n=1 Tax=Natronospirillum sp. TaxID=2812955 RepID=UPI0025EDC3AC|nr:coniferyl aldehyde dehydrogenase [Natronospirillum sp.]MCH8551760.1 coniferyl aldehyde dehydrogenase [Natronospirillum sp.]